MRIVKKKERPKKIWEWIREMTNRGKLGERDGSEKRKRERERERRRNLLI